MTMQRREFITLLGGAAMVWPLAARAQQGERVRHLGILMNLAVDDPESQARIRTFLQGLGESGWIEGRNITRGIPIVFVLVVDPVGSGYVASLARPGGNITGFTLFEYGISVKWLELLKEIAPWVTRAAVLRDPALSATLGQFAAIQAVAPSFGVELTPVDVRDAGEIERVLTAFARGPNGGLIVTPSPSQAVHRDLIIDLAARQRLPAVHSQRYMVTAGALISYGPDRVDPYRRAASYVDRILKGEKPSDLPVQAPTKYQLVINLKTAKALGIEVPPTLLARADEVIE